MKRIAAILLAFTCSLQATAQSSKKISTYLLLQVGKTLYDRTITNNNSGPSLGLKAFYNNKTALKPFIEIDGSIFGGTKELHMTTTGKVIESKDGVVCVFAGVTFLPVKNVYIEMAAGPAFFNGSSYLAIKPGAGVYFSKKHKLFAAVSLTNIFQRDDISNEQFGYLNFTLGIKLF